MLYVFHVDTGTMMTFDMNLTLEKVMSLQGVIAKGCHIPEDKQVLLISGGESLDPKAIVGKYHAGTDTNPIFLFSKSTIEAATPPSPSVNYGSDTDLQGQVEGSLLMPPAYETVVSRAQLALQFQEVDTDELRACERLIHDQHLQQQGWAAVVANLEDITSELQQRSELFHEAYLEYLENRTVYRDLIRSVSTSLQLLRKIPLLQSLTPSSCEGAPAEDPLKTTLFDWISSQDTNHSLHDMVEQCDKATEQLDERVQESLKSEVEVMLKEVQNESMKEVKGLEDRLYGLDQIISGARKIVQEQAELAQGFLQNQNRLSNLRDRSILPDLCASHRGQLVEMLKNHTRLREIKKKCRMAKEELSINLHTRLRWVMYVEKKICDVDGKLTIYLGNLKRLKKRLDILKQVHDAPKVYALLVIEVVRRKKFSRKFLMWATSLADDCNNLQTEEFRRREAFSVDIGHHFLQSLFQGLDDLPPPFANEAPDIFDSHLPSITIEDIHQLKEEVPELSGILSVPVDEELFKEKDTKTEVSSTVEHHLPVPRTSLGASSDTEVHPNGRKQPYSLDGGSVSLGDQFTECEGDEEIIPKPGFVSVSPPDKEFMLAKSLSDELTQEMKVDKDRVKQKTGGETSQEFTTADFYIDESMPSSIESPPKTTTSNDSKTNLEQLLNEEKISNEKLQSDLKDCYQKLSVYVADFRSLKQVVEDKLPKIKELIRNFKTAHADEVEKFHKDFDAVKDNIVEALLKSIEELNVMHRKEVDIVQAEKSDIVAKLSSEIQDLNLKHELELEVETDKVKADLHLRISELEKEMERLEGETKIRNKSVFSQTETVILRDLRIQTDKVQSSNHSIQTEEFQKECVQKVDQSDLSVQTDSQPHDQTSTQTETVSLNQLSTQTEQQVQNQSSTQTEILSSDELSTQTDQQIQNQSSTQTDTLLSGEFSTQTDQQIQNQSSTQTDTVSLSQLSTQTDKGVQNQSSTQTEISLSDKLSAQTDQQIQNQSSTQTDTVSSNQLSTQTDRQVQNQSSTQTEISLSDKISSQADQQIQNQSSTQTETVSSSQLSTQTEKQVQNQSSTQTDMQVQNQSGTQTESELEVKTEKPVNQSNISPQTDSLEDGNQNMHDEYEKKLAEIEQKYSATIDKLIADLEREKEDSQLLKSSLTSLAGDKQVKFNEAVSKVSQGKDRVIEELRKREEELLELLEKDKENMQKLKEEKSKSDEIKDRAMSLLKDKELEFSNSQRILESELGLAKQQVVQYQEQLQTLNPEITSMTSPSVIDISSDSADDHDLQQKVKDLEGAVKCKDEELGKVKQKLMELSMTASSRSLVQDKVSITRMDLYWSWVPGLPRKLYRPVRVISWDELKVKVFCKADNAILQFCLEYYSKSISDETDINENADDPMIDAGEPKDDEGVSKTIKSENCCIYDRQVALLCHKFHDAVMYVILDESCHVGDLVLLCLDERLDQYVVFTVGTTLHFLHTDCLNILGLKLATGESKKQWLIAEVTDKEYCQAKKPNNRFKVPVGTKFYRVKAKPWTRDSTLSDTACASSSS